MEKITSDYLQLTCNTSLLSSDTFPSILSFIVVFATKPRISCYYVFYYIITSSLLLFPSRVAVMFCVCWFGTRRLTMSFIKR